MARKVECDVCGYQANDNAGVIVEGLDGVFRCTMCRNALDYPTKATPDESPLPVTCEDLECEDGWIPHPDYPGKKYKRCPNCNG